MDYSFYWAPQPKLPNPRWFIVAVVIALLVLAMCAFAHAQEINVERLADAIYLAEGGSRTAHPYGILTRYRNTSPRQACINTIRHVQRDFEGRGDFIAFLGARYCPVGAKNDPRGLNKNWVRNVRKLYGRTK